MGHIVHISEELLTQKSKVENAFQKLQYASVKSVSRYLDIGRILAHICEYTLKYFSKDLVNKTCMCSRLRESTLVCNMFK